MDEELIIPWQFVISVLVFAISFMLLHRRVRKYLDADSTTAGFPTPLWFNFLIALIVFTPILWVNLIL